MTWHQNTFVNWVTLESHPENSGHRIRHNRKCLCLSSSHIAIVRLVYPPPTHTHTHFMEEIASKHYKGIISINVLICSKKTQFEFVFIWWYWSFEFLIGFLHISYFEYQSMAPNSKDYLLYPHCCCCCCCCCCWCCWCCCQLMNSFSTEPLRPTLYVCGEKTRRSRYV